MFLRPFSRNYSALASKNMATSSSLFTKVVVEAMRKLYPEKLADSSFDNTGLLLEAPARSHLKNSVLLTVDLTKAVVDEAIERKDSVIIAYHPIIFRPLKAMTLANTQQASLLRCAQEGISVYCPHTAVDASPEGNNDWLADIVTEHMSIKHDRQVITPVTTVPEIDKAGYGRIVRFEEPQVLGEILTRIMKDMSGIEQKSHLNLALPQSIPLQDRFIVPISSIGICAGSGGSILSGVGVDMLFTGELAHHEALAAIEQGRVVVTTYHSNSERGFLHSRMRYKLDRAIEDVVTSNDPRFAELSSIGGYSVAVSEADRDPFIHITGTLT